MSLYVSYLEEDRALGESVYSALSRYGIRCEDRDGLLSAGVTDIGVAAAEWFDVYLIIWSQRSMTSRALMQEIEYAKNSLSLLVVDDARVPHELKRKVLPEQLYSDADNMAPLAHLLQRFDQFRIKTPEVEAGDFSIDAAANLLAGSDGNLEQTRRELLSGKRFDVVFGDWVVSPCSCEVQRSSKISKLTPRTMDVLMAIIEQQGRVVTKEDLLAKVWKGRVVGDNSLHQKIAEIRKILGDPKDEPSYIETVARGYRSLIPLKVPAKGLLA